MGWGGRVQDVLHRTHVGPTVIVEDFSIFRFQIGIVKRNFAQQYVLRNLVNSITIYDFEVAMKML